MNAYLERARAWWAALAERERRVLGGGAIALGLILLYTAAWDPLTSARAQRRLDLQDARATAVQLEQLAGAAPRGAAPTAGAGQSLLAIVDQSHKASTIGKPPTRLQPDGDKAVRIWLEDVPYDALLRWLGELQTRYGVRVDAAAIQRESGPGLVTANLTLARD
jgi:general secretion pathway protein M